MFRLWYSTRSFANYIVAHSAQLGALQTAGRLTLRKLYESDANNPANFHALPTHIKQILYLDAPDLIIELDNHPILSIEVSEEAGSGHNAFQRFCRLAAAVERGVPALYIYPEAVRVKRGTRWSWDQINPLVFDALDNVMRVHQIPALLFYYPTLFRSKVAPAPGSKGHIYDKTHIDQPDSGDSQMRSLFATVDLIVGQARTRGYVSPNNLMSDPSINGRRRWMSSEWTTKHKSRTWSPLTATMDIPTTALLALLQTYAGKTYRFSPDGMASRSQTVVYMPDAKLRADPYGGALAAIDYIKCRTGPTYEDREKNLVIAWGSTNLTGGKLAVSQSKADSVAAFVGAVQGLYGAPGKVLLGQSFASLSGSQIARYYMQVRFGTTFTKAKELRVLSYFCDAILFHDGALWREG